MLLQGIFPRDHHLSFAARHAHAPRLRITDPCRLGGQAGFHAHLDGARQYDTLAATFANSQKVGVCGGGEIYAKRGMCSFRVGNIDIYGLSESVYAFCFSQILCSTIISVSLAKLFGKE